MLGINFGETTAEGWFGKTRASAIASVMLLTVIVLAVTMVPLIFVLSNGGGNVPAPTQPSQMNVPGSPQPEPKPTPQPAGSGELITPEHILNMGLKFGYTESTKDLRGNLMVENWKVDPEKAAQKIIVVNFDLKAKTPDFSGTFYAIQMILKDEAENVIFDARKDKWVYGHIEGNKKIPMRFPYAPYSEINAQRASPPPPHSLDTVATNTVVGRLYLWVIFLD